MEVADCPHQLECWRCRWHRLLWLVGVEVETESAEGGSLVPPPWESAPDLPAFVAALLNLPALTEALPFGFV